MKKISIWLVALVTSLISLIAISLFGFLLSVILYYIGKVPFLTDIIEFFGEILDLGLTGLIAIFLAGSIWKAGQFIIEKINGKEIEFSKSPIYYINCIFFFNFLIAVVIFGIDFVSLIKDIVKGYTADSQGLGTVIMFFEAIKDTFLYVRNENLLLYKLGYNSLILFIINGIYSDNI